MGNLCRGYGCGQFDRDYSRRYDPLANDKKSPPPLNLLEVWMTVAAGLAEIDITPPPGIDLTGYIARDGPATGVLDPLYARALVLADGGQRVALLTCDLLGLHRRDVQAVRGRIEAAAGIPADHVLITCSHTHAGPATLRLQDCGEIDPAYLATLGDKLVAVTAQAAATLRPARLGVGHGQVTAGIHNRRQPGDVLDPALGVLRIEDEQGGLMGVVLNFACHPTCLTGENRLFSAEYCGYAVEQIRQATGVPALFITGAIGDVGPVARGNEVLTQIGDAVGKEALRVLADITPRAWSGIAVEMRTVDLPLLPPWPAEQLAAEITRWQQTALPEATPLLPPHPKIPGAMVGWAKRTLGQVRSGRVPPAVTTEIQAIRVGDLLLVSAPGELFVELGLAVKQGAGDMPLFLCGFGNDNIGYIPTRRAYPLGGYEVDEAYKYYGYPAALAPEAGELYVKTALELVQALLPKSP
jgi:neutral ceramidase